ncbi:putative membrane protein [Wolbachia endosymbiont of Drosophila ananassae]|nr:putative membrane protein [Wolbachia endosymbiont of Drosophila ananassae]
MLYHSPHPLTIFKNFTYIIIKNIVVNTLIEIFFILSFLSK